MKEKLIEAPEEVQIQSIDPLPFVEPEIDARYYTQLPVAKTIISMSAPMKEGFGHFFFLKLIAELLLKFDNLYFVIITNEIDPDFEFEFLEALDKPYLKADVEYMKYGRDLPDILKASNIFVSPFKPMGAFPSIVLKAMAAGLPVVSMSSQLTRRVFIDEENGILVDEKELESAIEKISKLITDPEYSERIGLNGQKMVLDQFSIKQ